MKFYMTAEYEILDPSKVFKNLTEEQQADLLYDATDMWEKNFGRSGGDWPTVVTESRPFEDCLGELIV